MRGFYPVPHQINFFEDVGNLLVKSIIICSARGTSKTICLADTALWSVCVLPYFIRIPCRVVVISGSQMQSDILYEYCMGAIETIPFIQSQVVGKPLRHETKFKMGFIKALPASLKSTLGHRADLLIVDEACEAGSDIIKRAMSIVSGSSIARIILSSTPHIYLSLFVDIWEDPEKYGFVKHGYWSQLDCDWISAEDIARLKLVLDDITYSIDVLGEPKSPDTFFPLDDLKVCRTEDQIKYDKSAMTRMGIDWGWAPAPLVVTVIQVLGVGDHVQVIYQKPFKRKSPKKMDEIIDGLISQYDIGRIIADRSHIHENQRLRERGYHVQEIKFKSMKGQIMGELRRLIMNHEIDIWEQDWKLIDELRRYTQEKKKGQDRVDSLALAVWKAQRSKIGLLVPRSGSYMRTTGVSSRESLKDLNKEESS